jgi:hypothetical protein
VDRPCTHGTQMGPDLPRGYATTALQYSLTKSVPTSEQLYGVLAQYISAQRLVPTDRTQSQCVADVVMGIYPSSVCCGLH